MQRSAVGSPSDFFLLLDLGGDFVSLRELVTAERRVQKHNGRCECATAVVTAQPFPQRTHSLRARSGVT